MNDWHFFANLFTQISGLVQAGGDTILNGAMGYARPALLAAITCWIAFQAVVVANGMAPMNSLYRGVIRAAVVVMVLQSTATYNQYIGTIALAIPTEIGNALGSAVGANVASGAVFDTVWDTAAKSGMVVWKHIPQYSLSGAILTLCVAGYFIVVVVCIAAGFLIYLASTVLLILLLKVGPLFVALYAFPQTQRIANGWISAVVTSILTQVFAVAILVLFVGAEQATVTRILAAASNGAAPNFIDELMVLLQAGLLMWIISMLVKQAPGLASSIAGGVYQSMSSFTGAAFGAPKAIGAAARGAASKAGTGISATSAAAGKAIQAYRASATTGKSLSGG